MGISTKARYALRIMVRLARMDPGASATVLDLSAREDVSTDYAAQIMMAMRRGGLIASRRGAGGGVSLAREASQISVADVIEAAEGPIRVVDCTEDGADCRRAAVCVTREVWEEATRRLKSFFEGVTVESLAARAEARDKHSGTMFEI
jgi:Rrf2 family protein